MKVNIKVPRDHHPPTQCTPLSQKELQTKYIAVPTNCCR